MGRLADHILNDKWKEIERGELLFSTQSRDPVFDHFTQHCYAAYEYYGCPFYCASIGDTMGNQIRIAALRKQDEVNSLRSRAFHEYVGIGLHNQHVIDYHMTGAGRGQLLDLTYYNQIYSVPLLPRR